LAQRLTQAPVYQKHPSFFYKNKKLKSQRPSTIKTIKTKNSKVSHYKNKKQVSG
jgi:hypothetical protein